MSPSPAMVVRSAPDPGPGVTGVLLGLGTSASTIFYLAAGAMVVAGGCAALLRASMRSADPRVLTRRATSSAR